MSSPGSRSLSIARLIRDLSPALAPASGVCLCLFSVWTEPKLLPVAAKALAWPRLLAYGDCSGLAMKWPKPILPLDCSARLAACPTTPLHAPLKDGRLALGLSLVHAVSRTARGQAPPPPSRRKSRQFQSLAAFHPNDLLPRRQLESAPQPAIWQASRPRLIHFSPVCLWTAVDKSTVSRICRRCRSIRERNCLPRVRFTAKPDAQTAATRLRRRDSGVPAAAAADR